MPKKKQKEIFDTAIEVKAGYPDKKFFPNYNGRETKYADLFSKMELMYVGDGLVLDCNGEDPKIIIDRIKVNARLHKLRPPIGHRFSYRKYTEKLGEPHKLLITVVKIIGDRKQRKLPKNKHIIVDLENRTESQIEADRKEELLAYRAYVKSMKEIKRKRAEKDSPEFKAEQYKIKRSESAKKKRALHRKRVEDGKKAAVHLVAFQKEQNEKRRIAKEKLARKLEQEHLDKVRRIEKRRLKKSKLLKQAIADKKKLEEGEQ